MKMIRWGKNPHIMMFSNAHKVFTFLDCVALCEKRGVAVVLRLAHFLKASRRSLSHASLSLTQTISSFWFVRKCWVNPECLQRARSPLEWANRRAVATPLFPLAVQFILFCSSHYFKLMTSLKIRHLERQQWSLPVHLRLGQDHYNMAAGRFHTCKLFHWF